MSKISDTNRIATLFYGIHYMNDYRHWMGWKTCVDFRKSIDNYRKYLLTFKNKICQNDIFISTYDSDISSKLMEEYKPISNISIPFNEKINNVQAKYDRLLNGLSLIENYKKTNDLEYKWYIITRFDLFFKKNIESLSIMEDKINIPYRAKIGNEIKDDDNLYIFSENMFYKFIECIKFHPSNIWLHEIQTYSNKLPINYMILGEYFSHESPLYNIIR